MAAKAKKLPTELRYVRGIGPRRAEALGKLGVHTLRDFIYLFPRRYEDRSQILKIQEVAPGDKVTTRGEVITLGARPVKQTQIFELVIGDETGILHAIWFNQLYLKNQFQAGMKVILSGRVEIYQNRLQMNSPDYEIVEDEEENPIHMGRITPIYPLTEGLYQRSLRTTMKEVVDQFLDQEIEDFLPPSLKDSLELIGLRQALREMHFPSNFETLTAARRRIVFDEFFLFEFELLRKFRLEREGQKTIPFLEGRKHLEEFKKSLPFALTQDQERVMKEILGDCEQTFSMNRLLQGEVASGKTLVATFALFLATRKNHQAAFLVPTEILAEQHARSLEGILTPLGVRSELLTASTPQDQRAEILKDLEQGQLPILVGTHALLQEEVRFRSLALVVIDEQHKFGVRQRGYFLQNSPRPHQLVMTATPIPRTLALTFYGDLEISTMKELPRGRAQVKTYWITREKQTEVLKHIRDRIVQGEQAYLVFPIIDETERSDLFAAREECERLKKKDFKDLALGLVHGRLAKEEREAIMNKFRSQNIQLLVATSVIEVGVDNPNASIMVIENAERFGLSQLHQLRGRVGRGGKESECFLFGEPKTEEGKRRLRLLTKTNDGFLIAEEDLRLRGPGELLGTRQSGEPYFRVANLAQDESVLLLARRTALSILKEDPHLSAPVWEGLNSELARNETSL